MFADADDDANSGDEGSSGSGAVDGAGGSGSDGSRSRDGDSSGVEGGGSDGGQQRWVPPPPVLSAEEAADPALEMEIGIVSTEHNGESVLQVLQYSYDADGTVRVLLCTSFLPQ